MRTHENILRPFEFMKLVRDGDTKAIEMLYYCGTSRMMYFLETAIRGLVEAGFAEQSDKETPPWNYVKPTEAFLNFLRAFDLSLTQLAPYTTNSIICNPIFGSPQAPPKQAKVFVLMPFLNELKPVYDDHISKVTERLSLSTARADDFFTANSIVRDIWNAIFSADLLIADCTGRNPNVFYEIGIGHAIGRPVILISQKVEDIPFDLKHLRTIVYDFTPRGMKQFETDLESTIQSVLERPKSLKELADKIAVGRDIDQ